MGYKETKLIGFHGPLPVPYPLNVVKTIQCQAFRVRGEGGLRLYWASSWYMLDTTVLVPGEGPYLYFASQFTKTVVCQLVRVASTPSFFRFFSAYLFCYLLLGYSWL